MCKGLLNGVHCSNHNVQDTTCVLIGMLYLFPILYTKLVTENIDICIISLAAFNLLDTNVGMDMYCCKCSLV